MQSRRGTDIPNQFEIQTDEGIFFQSYSSLIAHKSRDGKIYLDTNKWDYSNTTGKYLHIFLGTESRDEIRRRIKEGRYILKDLNT